MRRGKLLALTILVAFAVFDGVVAVAGGQRPDDCEKCGNEFKDVQPSSCGLLMDSVEAYRANGEFIAVFDNRCFACTMDVKTFCTVGSNTRAAELGESPRDESEAVFVDPCNRGQCLKDYRECLKFCSKNLCIIDCGTRLEICLDQCGKP